MSKKIAFLSLLGGLLVSLPAFAQMYGGPSLWSHRFPGQSSPSIYGYGAPPTGRGPMARFSMSPMDMAMAEAMMNMTQPFLGGNSYGGGPGMGGGYFAAVDPYQGAFGNDPGWSAPFDVDPATRPRASARAPSVFMP